jgi:hypothetical protein
MTSEELNRAERAERSYPKPVRNNAPAWLALHHIVLTRLVTFLPAPFIPVFLGSSKPTLPHLYANKAATKPIGGRSKSRATLSRRTWQPVRGRTPDHRKQVAYLIGKETGRPVVSVTSERRGPPRPHESSTVTAGRFLDGR